MNFIAALRQFSIPRFNRLTTMSAHTPNAPKDFSKNTSVIIHQPPPPSERRYKLNKFVKKLTGFKRPSWQSLSHTGKLGVAVIPTTILWIVSAMVRRRTTQLNIENVKELLPSLLAAYGKSIGLIGIKDLYDEMKQNLGVKLTLTRTYQVFSLLGYAMTTFSELYWPPAAGLGRAYFLINCIYTGTYAYMLFLTMVYNSRLEGRSRAFESSFSRNSTTRQSLNLPALLIWCAFQAFTGNVWLNEARNGMKHVAQTGTIKTLSNHLSSSAATSVASSISSAASSSTTKLASTLASSTSRKGPKEAFTALAFLLTSLGPMRSGFRTSMTSIPDISPFAGTLILALSSLLSASALLPYWSKSSVARIHLAGYASVIYSVFLNSYYAFKQQKIEQKQSFMWKLSRRAKL